MPVAITRGRGGINDDPVPKYGLPCAYDLCPIKLEAYRKAAARRRDDMIALQKECGARQDREGARFFKEEAADALKEYRAVCLLLPWYTQEAGGDAPLRDLYEIGPELFPYLERAEGALHA